MDYLQCQPYLTRALARHPNDCRILMFACANFVVGYLQSPSTRLTRMCSHEPGYSARAIALYCPGVGLREGRILESHLPPIGIRGRDARCMQPHLITLATDLHCAILFASSSCRIIRLSRIGARRRMNFCTLSALHRARLVSLRRRGDEATKSRLYG
jgi:hypothetical protein